MTSRRDQQGMTMIEMIIGLGIGAVLVSVLASLLAALIWLPQNRGDKAALAQDLQFAQHWITRDANAADTFVPGANPTLGTFTWSDYTAASKINHSIVYAYDAANGYVTRTEQQNGTTTAAFVVAKNVTAASDVVFSWSPSTYSLVITIRSTVTTGTPMEGVTTTSRTAAMTVALRPRSENAASAPGSTPVPTPLPGSQTYYVALAPALSTGSYISGGAAELQTSDRAYYVADSSRGADNAVVYTVQSQSLTLPATISQIQVLYVGMSDRSGVSVNFYVKSSASGFSAVPDSGFTFTQAGEVRSNSLFLTSAALSYLTSLPDRRVDVLVSASGSMPFTLSSDQLVFVVSP